MGFDITYHPMSEAEICSCFFDLKKDASLRAGIFDRFNISAEEREQIDQLINIEFDESVFNTGEGMCLAGAAGYYRKYWYLRGGAFSFVLENHPDYVKYCRSWKELLPEGRFDDVRDCLQANYMVGCYLSEAGVRTLLADIREKPDVKIVLEENFSDGRLEVFIEALEYAAENNTGLIEAAEIIQPNPFDLENSQFVTKANNCEMQGVALYVSAATDQMMQAMESASTLEQNVNGTEFAAASERGAQATNVPPASESRDNASQPAAEKKGFWNAVKRWF